MATASQIHLSSDHLGLVRSTKNPVGSLEAASRILQKNHDEHHIFWREVAGHNHISHSVLSTFALGGSPVDIQRAFDDGVDIQRPVPPVNNQIVNEMSNPTQFLAHVGELDQYPNFLAFFTNRIEEKGWIDVVQEYCFSRKPIAEKIFAQLFEGLYHPLIHLGLGVEFGQPSIIAEGLAQAACHDSMGVESYFIRSVQEAARSTKPNKPLAQLIHAVRTNEALRNAARPFTTGSFTDGPARVRDGVLSSNNQALLADIAAQFRVKPQDLERGLVETINSSAYTTGAAQRPGKARKIDFFHMHSVTASIPLTVLVRQPWISITDKIRLVEWKGRLDLVWYAASAAVELRLEDVVNYSPGPSTGMDWNALYRAVLTVHDDGHLVKLVRGLKHGEEISKPFENEGAESFPIKGDSWLKIAQMAYDSTVGRPILEKWIWGVGFDENWANVPKLEQH
jgi:questin oxidase-like protein